MFSNMECIDQIETYNNPTGICGMAYNDEVTVVVLPHKDQGMLKVHTYEGETGKDMPIRVHEKEIQAVSVNPDCTLIASASKAGTVIRITCVSTGEVLQELRRGSGHAQVQNIVFHPYLNLLVANSDRKSCHVFEIKKSIEKSNDSDGSIDKRKNVQADNRKSKAKFLKVFNKFFDSDWAVSKVKLEEDEKIVGFDANNHALSIMTKD